MSCNICLIDFLPGALLDIFLSCGFFYQGRSWAIFFLVDFFTSGHLGNFSLIDFFTSGNLGNFSYVFFYHFMTSGNLSVERNSSFFGRNNPNFWRKKSRSGRIIHNCAYKIKTTLWIFLRIYGFYTLTFEKVWIFLHSWIGSKNFAEIFYQAVDFLRPWIFYYMRRFDQVKDAKFEFIR